MKHRVWSLLAAILLLAAACVLSVSAESAEPVCPHCNVALSQITWENWAGTKGDFKMEQKIIEALQTIRPILQRDGGDIEFVELTEDNIVKVRLQGHCAGCPGAQMTIKGVVERIIKEAYPEIKAVEAVQ